MVKDLLNKLPDETRERIERSLAQQPDGADEAYIFPFTTAGGTKQIRIPLGDERTEVWHIHPSHLIENEE